MTTLDAICWLCGIIVVAGCYSKDLFGNSEVRDPKHPWIIYDGRGGFRVDTSHPEWQRMFNENLKKWEGVTLEQLNRMGID